MSLRDVLGLPLLTLIWQSFFRNLAQPFFSSPAQATLDNYDFILRYPIFLAALTYSAHEIRHSGFRHAIERYIADEEELLTEIMASYARRDPYKS